MNDLVHVEMARACVSERILGIAELLLLDSLDFPLRPLMEQASSHREDFLRPRELFTYNRRHSVPTENRTTIRD